MDSFTSVSGCSVRLRNQLGHNHMFPGSKQCSMCYDSSVFQVSSTIHTYLFQLIEVAGATAASAMLCRVLEFHRRQISPPPTL